eukprot:s1033_g4.t1
MRELCERALDRHEEDEDPSQGIEDEYKSKHNKTFMWQSRRLFGRHHLRVYTRKEVYGKTDFMDFLRSARNRTPPPAPAAPVETVEEKKAEEKAEGEAVTAVTAAQETGQAEAQADSGNTPAAAEAMEEKPAPQTILDDGYGPVSAVSEVTEPPTKKAKLRMLASFGAVCVKPEGCLQPESAKVQFRAQRRWSSQVPNVQKGIVAGAQERVLESERQEASLLLPPHVFSASFYPSWLDGADGEMEEHLDLKLWKSCRKQIQNASKELRGGGGARAHGPIGKSQGVASHQVSPRKGHEILYVYHHATVHRRPLVSVSLPPSRPLIGRTLPESLETLLGLKKSLGRGKWGEQQPLAPAWSVFAEIHLDQRDQT